MVESTSLLMSSFPTLLMIALKNKIAGHNDWIVEGVCYNFTMLIASKRMATGNMCSNVYLTTPTQISNFMLIVKMKVRLCYINYLVYKKIRRIVRNVLCFKYI